MDGTGKMFRPLIEHLPKEWDIRVVSYTPDRPLGYDQLTKEASQAIPATGPYFLLGESFSGPIAISLAESADERLKGVILCCTFMRSPISALKYIGGFLSKLSVSLIPRFILEAILFGRFRSEPLSRLLTETLDIVSDEALSKRVIEIRDIDVSEKLRNIKTPLIYLRATEDRLVGPKEALAISSIAKHTTIVDLSGPHCLLQASPAAAAEKISDFVKEHSS
jgi:pimeloyl-ACP methyl ester carboxylesterase